ncbi:efflux RND transporter permease subunit [Methylobacterium oryzae CBMB20]
MRLGDVARIELGAANLDRETRLNGSPATVVAIYQSPGANALATLKEVEARVGALAKSFPEGLAWKVTYDPTTFITETVHEVRKTLVEAFVLVVIVVFLFLGSLRATLIPTLAVPVSLIGTFIALKAVGYSANSVSLLALVLAIGIVVDDAIVVVENVERVMEEHPDLSPREATKRAMAEITAPIIAITLVLLSVFVPVAFVPGISGELFRQFAVAVAVAMLISAVNALTLSPALCGVLLRPHHGPRTRPHGRHHAGDRLGARRLRRGRGADRPPLGDRPRARRRGRLRHPAARQDDTHRLPAGGRPGRLLRRGAAARRAPRSGAPPRWWRAPRRSCGRSTRSPTRHR